MLRLAFVRILHPANQPHGLAVDARGIKAALWMLHGLQYLHGHEKLSFPSGTSFGAAWSSLAEKDRKMQSELFVGQSQALLLSSSDSHL